MGRFPESIPDSNVGFLDDNRPDFLVDDNFDDNEEPTIDTSDAGDAIDGQLSIEYNRPPAGLAPPTKLTVQIFFRAIQQPADSGNCVFSDVVGRVTI